MKSCVEIIYIILRKSKFTIVASLKFSKLQRYQIARDLQYRKTILKRLLRFDI